MPIAAMSKFPIKPKNIPGTSVRLTPVQLRRPGSSRVAFHAMANFF